jgi:8-oxo-dGTP pyrophosphatase MutT (NUDIX family)
MTNFEALCEQIKSKLDLSDPLHFETMGAQQAAVALVLRRNQDAAELLMIKRAIRAGDHWSGHLALPGGRWQLPDTNLLNTAIRETYEEVGIDLSVDSQVLGQLTTLKPRNPRIPQVDVTPYIFTAPTAFHLTSANEEPQLLTLNHEVAAAFWVPVDYLKSQGLSDAFQYNHEGVERSWPAYPSEHGPIWGLTERMLTNFLEVIA